MAGGKIYTKTIDSSVQDGVDNSLIIQPNYAYQVPFGFDNEWTEIKLGMFISYTDSPTGDNVSFTSGLDRDSGGDTNDTFSYFGIIEDKSTKFIPETIGTGSFCGVRFHRLNRVTDSLGNDGWNTLGGEGFPGDVAHRDLVSNSDVVQSQQVDSPYYIPFTNASDTINFASYIGMSFKIFNKGTSNQYVVIKNYRISQTEDANSNMLTDISLINLRNLINGNDELTHTSSNLLFAPSGIAATIPDSFFFYNAFLYSRPRIHAIAVKKIS